MAYSEKDIENIHKLSECIDLAIRRSSGSLHGGHVLNALMNVVNEIAYESEMSNADYQAMITQFYIGYRDRKLKDES